MRAVLFPTIATEVLALKQKVIDPV